MRSVVLLASVTVIEALRFCVLSKVIIDQVAGGGPRLGGGGVQAAVGIQIGHKGQGPCCLIAPVGIDFDDGLLTGLTQRGIDTSGICRLPHVATTPGEVIRYEGERMVWDAVGWEHWKELCAWRPPVRMPDYDAIHVIVEGAGDGEVQSVLDAAAASTERPLISVEPVMHEVDEASIAGLARLTAMADVVSPDLITAARIADATNSAACENAPHDSTAVAQLNDAALLEMARRCARALQLPSEGVLAIRDGANGSLLLCRDELTRVPAVPTEVVDPTGAGNAYAGALCAQLAGGAAPVAAAAVASAVGAAFCRSGDWAPDIEEATEWVFRQYDQL